MSSYLKTSLPFGERTSLTGEVGINFLDKQVTLYGWVRRRRDHGGVIFVDLADYTDHVQVVFRPEHNAIFKIGEELRSEFVIAIRGAVKRRPDGTVNSDLTTGEIEVEVNEAEILSRSETLPFQILDQGDLKEETRLRYRYLDLRRPQMQKIIRMRHKVYTATRDYLNGNGFTEIETPMLTKTTPEGARDFLVPSRLSPGEFYALPQSPQLFKQVLMVSGFDRYYQIVRCFRDEDLRANRQPEFTQIDIEMTFVDEEIIKRYVAGLVKKIWKEVRSEDLDTDFPRMSYDDSISKYGVDAPDLRFGLELIELSDIFKRSSFDAFTSALTDGGTVKGINVKGGGSFSRKEVDELNEFVKNYGASGLGSFKVEEDGSLKSPLLKYLDEQSVADLIEITQAKSGDLIVVLAGTKRFVNTTLSALRLHLAKKLNLIDPNKNSFCWIEKFPLFEWDEDARRYLAVHHPFTSPLIESEEDYNNLINSPEKLYAKAYDLVLNGQEIAGGSIRIHNSEIQKIVFEKLGIQEEEAKLKFGFLLDAFSFGAPPHGGIAFGLDRLIMILSGTDSIRDVIAFPKTQKGVDLMVNAPSPVDPIQLREVYIKTTV